MTETAVEFKVRVAPAISEQPYLDANMIDIYTKRLTKVKTNLERLVLQALMASPQTRASLCRATGCDDRANRKAIERLRNAGIAVVSSSHGKGYQLASNMEDVQKFVADMLSRVTKLRRTAYRVKQAYALYANASMDLSR